MRRIEGVCYSTDQIILKLNDNANKYRQPSYTRQTFIIFQGAALSFSPQLVINTSPKRLRRDMDSQSTWPDSSNLAYVEELYELYLRDPDALDEGWREHFKRWAGSNGHTQNAAAVSDSTTTRPTFTPRSLFNPAGGSLATGSDTRSQLDLQRLQHQVGKLVRLYRVRGHRAAAFDPLGQTTRTIDRA